MADGSSQQRYEWHWFGILEPNTGWCWFGYLEFGEREWRLGNKEYKRRGYEVRTKEGKDMAVYWDATKNDWEDELNEEMSLRETQDEGVARQREYEEEEEQDRRNRLAQEKLGAEELATKLGYS